jgi:hypothetical protein
MQNKFSENEATSKPADIPPMIKVIIVAFGVLAIASFAASCWHGVNLLGLFRTTHSTVGHVIARETKARRGRGSSYTPVVLYRTDDGIEFKVTGKVYSSYVSANVGDVVAVRYDPANPATAVIATFSELWLPLLLWAGFSLMWGLRLRWCAAMPRTAAEMPCPELFENGKAPDRARSPVSHRSLSSLGFSASSQSVLACWPCTFASTKLDHRPV